MEVAFFGTGCAIPTAATGHTAFLVTTRREGAGGTTILVDAVDSPVRSMMRLGLDPLELDVVIITHYHADHISAFPALLSTFNCMERSKPLKVVADGETSERARRLADLLDLGPDQLSFPISYDHEHTDPTVTIRLTPGRHTVQSSMVRFESADGSLFYTSDTQYYDGIAMEASGCGMLIHEATTSQRTVAALPGHSSAAQAGKTARAAGARSLFLCHICYADYDGEAAIVREAEQEFAGDVIVPETLLPYTIAPPVE